ncbi:hypothetical protein PHYBOEH_005027 [Phytophthora boehmeriae]|uniref:RxLR effector protein n=1 Tax=Phytophthora boehmeriae TaxID=109152 RepID=A0A8T1WME7_9STRA|nr:hypothetical protein PHYBOEH_005027 [Phytophthora boehmeriae]
MRLRYFLIVATVTFFASADAVAAKTNSIQTTASMATLTDVASPVRSLADAEANEGKNERFLRRFNDDEEEDVNKVDEDEDAEDERMNLAGLKSGLKKLRALKNYKNRERRKS